MKCPPGTRFYNFQLHVYQAGHGYSYSRQQSAAIPCSIISIIGFLSNSWVSCFNKHHTYIYFTDTRHRYRDDRALADLHIDRVCVGINPKDSVGSMIVRNSQNMTTNVMCLWSIVTSDADKATTIGHPHLSLGTCKQRHAMFVPARENKRYILLIICNKCV